MKDKLYEYIANYVYQNSGILYKPDDYYRLDSRINVLLKHFSLEKEGDLLNFFLMNTDPKVFQVLIDICTNNETFFMRDLKPFQDLAKDMIPKFMENLSPLGKVNIWSCAASTGQEIYSILMAAEAFGKHDLNKIDLYATDISIEALEKAKNGVYNSLEVQRGLPAPFLVKYFEKIDEQTWKIKKEISKNISWGQFNLLKDFFPTNQYDIIFCRNVLIYQDADNKKKILQSIFNALKPGGFLVFGAGESLIGTDINLKQVQLTNGFAYQKEE